MVHLRIAYSLVSFRAHSYDPHEADIWSVGATIWEAAEGDPPFIEVEDPKLFRDRWPELDNADRFSADFHEFLRLCSEPAGRRPRAVELLRVSSVLIGIYH